MKFATGIVAKVLAAQIKLLDTGAIIKYCSQVCLGGP